MHHLAATLHTLGLRLAERAQPATRDERGSVTIEQVIFAVVAITIAGIVTAAIIAKVRAEAGKIT